MDVRGTKLDLAPSRPGFKRHLDAAVTTALSLPDGPDGAAL